MNSMLVIIPMLFTIIIISKLQIIFVISYGLKSIVISLLNFLMAYLFNTKFYNDIIIIYMYYKINLFYLIN